jgi:hypothetical protein
MWQQHSRNRPAFMLVPNGNSEINSLLCQKILPAELLIRKQVASRIDQINSNYQTLHFTTRYDAASEIFYTLRFPADHSSRNVATHSIFWFSSINFIFIIIIIVITIATTAITSPFQLHCSSVPHIMLDKKITENIN